MIKNIAVETLSGKALDFAAARIAFPEYDTEDCLAILDVSDDGTRYCPTSDRDQCLKLVIEFDVSVMRQKEMPAPFGWRASGGDMREINNERIDMFGADYNEAAVRAAVSSIYGRFINVPDELLPALVEPSSDELDPVIPASLQCGILTDEAGQTLDLIKVQQICNDAFLATGDEQFKAAVKDISLFTGKIQQADGSWANA